MEADASKVVTLVVARPDLVTLHSRVIGEGTIEVLQADEVTGQFVTTSAGTSSAGAIAHVSCHIEEDPLVDALVDHTLLISETSQSFTDTQPITVVKDNGGSGGTTVVRTFAEHFDAGVHHAAGNLNTFVINNVYVAHRDIKIVPKQLPKSVTHYSVVVATAAGRGLQQQQQEEQQQQQQQQQEEQQPLLELTELVVHSSRGVFLPKGTLYVGPVPGNVGRICRFRAPCDLRPVTAGERVFGARSWFHLPRKIADHISDAANVNDDKVLVFFTPESGSLSTRL